jgi:hypothetical protein
MKKYLLSICVLGLLLGLAMPSNAACNSLEEECLNETALVKVKAEEAKVKKAVEEEEAFVKEEAEEKDGDKKVIIEEMPAGGNERVKTPMCEEAGYVWDAGQGKCVPDPAVSIARCKAGQVEINGKCVYLVVGGDILCRKGQVAVNGKCVDAGTASHKIRIPSLQHFDLTDSEVDKDYIFLQFAPKGTPHFYLNVQLETVDGKDELSAWCTGDESLCKAVGNGEECDPRVLPTGSAAWCYLNEEEKPREPIVGPICENCERIIQR